MYACVCVYCCVCALTQIICIFDSGHLGVYYVKHIAKNLV